MHAPPYLFLQHASWLAIFILSSIAFVLISSRVNSQERNKASGEDHDRGSRTLIYILSPTGSILMFAAPYLFKSARIDLEPSAVFFSGIGLIWTGLLLYVWAVRTLGEFFRTSVQIFEGHRLVTQGPYRLVRHPIYTSGILIFAGMGLAIGNWVALAAALGTTIFAYGWRIHVEEAALKERFSSEFDNYRRRTWAVIPPLW